MNRKYISLLLVTNILLIITVIILLFFRFPQNTETKIVYVDNSKLLNGFNMFKDLKKSNSEKINSEKKKLDSLFKVYSSFREQKNEDKVKELGKKLRIQDQELKMARKKLSSETDKKVWKVLNQYIEEYGKNNQYKIILGSQGNGDVLFANEGIDITKDVLSFANGKHKQHN